MASIEVDLDDYIDECKKTLKRNGYLVFENEQDVIDFIDNKYKCVLSEYIEEMRKNLYIYSDKKIKTYEEVYNDLDNMLKG